MSVNPALETLPALRGRITALLNQLRALTEPAGAGEMLVAAMVDVEARGDIATLTERVRHLDDVVQEFQSQLHDALAETQRIELVRKRHSVGSATYWSTLREALHDAARRSDPSLVSLWLKWFGEAFAAWQLSVCEQLTQEPTRAPAALADIQHTMRGTLEALREGNHIAALPGLALLVDAQPGRWNNSPLESADCAAVCVVMGRIHLREEGDDAAAFARLEKAREAAPQDGRVYAALAEYSRHKNNDAAARDLSRQAITATPERPDGYVGMALSCEAQGWWAEAQTWYAQAVDVVLARDGGRDPLRELDQLLAPVSGALYLRLAHITVSTNPTLGLTAVDKAIELGIQGEGKYPQAAAYQLKGETLAVLNRPKEAAEALFQAGCYHTWEGKAAAATTLFERAHALDPAHHDNYWNWADALLLMSHVSMPPYVDRTRIEQSLDVWNRGVALGLPDIAQAWPYLTRGLIAEQLADLPDADRFQRTWEAVGFVEQSLLLDPDRAYSWVALGRAHYALSNHLTALHATETALLCGPDDPGALEQRIIVMVNLERYSEVRPLLAAYSRLRPTAQGWVLAVEGHLALYEGRPEAGLIATEGAIQQGMNFPWLHIDRFRQLRALGRGEEARKVLEDVWVKYDALDVGSQLSYGWCALLIGEVEAAIAIFTARLGDRVAGFAAIERYRGFAELLRGDIAAARRYLQRAIELADTARELEERHTNDLEVAEVCWALQGKSNAGAARAVLDEYRSGATKRLETFQSPTSPRDEMRRRIAASESCGQVGSWSWIGAQASFGRLCLEARSWQDAESVYRRLATEAGGFYVADEGLEQARHQGVALATQEEHTRLWSIYHERADIELRRLPMRLFGRDAMERLPAVTPLMIEGAANLKPILQEEDGELNGRFAEHLRSMRASLLYELGFEAPGALVRLNTHDLPDGTYVIHLREVPLVSGHVDPTQLLVDATVDQLRGMSITGTEAVNPVNSSECAWIEGRDEQNAKAAGLGIWTPAQFIMLHVLSVIRKNAADLVGLQAVANLLRERAADHYPKILAAPGGLPRFTSVIQALLSEETSITALPVICEGYLANQNLPTYEVPEAIRSLEAVRGSLLGNTPDTPIYRLGKNFIALIESGIKRDQDAAVLAIEPEPTQDALTAVRNEVTNLSPTAKNPALFVDDWNLRSFVRKLVELEFPHLAVLSKREAIASEARPVLGSIETERWWPSAGLK